MHGAAMVELHFKPFASIVPVQQELCQRLYARKVRNVGDPPCARKEGGSVPHTKQILEEVELQLAQPIPTICVR